jgi:hypothetical protein
MGLIIISLFTLAVRKTPMEHRNNNVTLSVRWIQKKTMAWHGAQHVQTLCSDAVLEK